MSGNGNERESRCRWNRWWLAGGITLITVLAIAALFCGRYQVTPGQALELIWTSFASGNFAGSLDEAKAAMVKRVLVQIRLPRICYCLAAGAGLAAAGAALQGICSNPLATPDTLGAANGASFGAALGILLGMNGFWIQVTSMLCGIAAVLLVFAVSRKHTGNPVLMLVLAGMVIGSFFSALLSAVKYVADPQDKLPEITHWLMGSMNAITWKSVTLGLPWLLTGLAVIWLLRWKLNAMSLAEEEARSLGVSTGLVRILVIAATTMITASVVSACGQIGWIGLLIPHGCRLLFGGDFRQLIPSCICLGSVFLLLVDTAARSLTAAELPVAILTAVVGAPLFLLLLLKKNR